MIIRIVLGIAVLFLGCAPVVLGIYLLWLYGNAKETVDTINRKE